ncbi:uncharacterized protein LOC109398212 [Aedes albopictus]|uniref:Secreted protein n=1 Tax=Aedes albopictus TaxID=7160 RepID=A0ABM1XX06_AEDAL|nr:uncharacterized protein LOC109419713 [Aedes albopictus]XP_029733532.1 uncharacterized protein LOC109398212 [Aedes albopictus]
MAMSSNIYAILVTCLGFFCLVISATAVGVPIWAYYESRGGEDRGYFGPWQKCQKISYRERCGDVGRFQPSGVVFTSGLMAVAGCAMFGIYCILSIMQIAMISSRDRICMKYNALITLKLVLVVLATFLSLAAAGLFALQTDDDRTGYHITRGISFYLQIVTVALSLALMVLSVYDKILTKRPDGDPTMMGNANGNATTYNNPGFRETNGIAVTNASGRPYSSINGSVQSVTTTMTTMSNGSTIGSGSVTRTPLRSSLKKPRPQNADGLGIRNPGYSENGTVKKVRIQTGSTDV